VLAWLGLRMLLEPGSSRFPERMHLQEFLVVAGNLKAIVLFTALFPQFIDATRSLLGQLAIMCPTMTLLDFFRVMLYAVSARCMDRQVARHPRWPGRRVGSPGDLARAGADRPVRAAALGHGPAGLQGAADPRAAATRRAGHVAEKPGARSLAPRL